MSDKLTRASLFRDRFATALAQSAFTQSALARAIGVDRSTISQLLTNDAARLPNAHVVGSVAGALGVSADWLLGLSDRPERAAELLAGSLAVTEAPRALVDEQIFAWHQEAAGYKIRHVPATLPDMLKTQSLLAWEYRPHLGRTTEQAIGAAEDKLAWMRGSLSDYEIALPLSELQAFLDRSGYYADLPPKVRDEQIAYVLQVMDQLYPRLRIYLFDPKRLYSAPLTIFGPLLCVFYAGSHYMAFRDRDRIATFTRHFDHLVREADITARDLPRFLQTADTAD
jgi:transcriptional regulator with XRE-family HTH domain